MKGCSWAEDGENCCRWGHIAEDLLRFSLAKVATASRNTEYDETILIDVEILRLVLMLFDVIASDMTLFDVHVEPVFCKYGGDG